MSELLEQPSEQSTPRAQRLTAAAIERWRTCERRYWHQDVARTAVEAEHRSPQLAQGLAVHAALAEFYRLPSPQERTPENLERALRSVWCRCREGAFKSREEEAESGRDALAMLARYAERFDLTVQPFALERSLRLRLENGVLVVGRIDRIDRAPASSGEPDGIEITDYKTARRELGPEDLPQETAVQVYVTAAEAQYRRPVTAVRFIYLRSGREVVWRPEAEDRAELRPRLEAVVSEIAAAEEFPVSPGRHCDWCPYELVCVERLERRAEELVVPEGMPF